MQICNYLISEKLKSRIVNVIHIKMTIIKIILNLETGIRSCKPIITMNSLYAPVYCLHTEKKSLILEVFILIDVCPPIIYIHANSAQCDYAYMEVKF